MQKTIQYYREENKWKAKQCIESFDLDLFDCKSLDQMIESFQELRKRCEDYLANPQNIQDAYVDKKRDGRSTGHPSKDVKFDSLTTRKESEYGYGGDGEEYYIAIYGIRDADESECKVLDDQEAKKAENQKTYDVRMFEELKKKLGK